MIDNNLKWCREELEMTQTELGNIFGVSNSTVRGWENAYDTIPLKKLVRFCNQFNYSLDFVLGLTRKNIKYNKDIKLSQKQIGKKLKLLREKLDLSQQQIADKCSIARSTYSHYEIGLSLITTLTLYTICKTYDISIDWFVGRTDNKKIKI
ncbi:MAG: XRE family transcriptional regulator [Bacilli bacterium]|nr:XRE family transcriptional regulator [Bacilli bacterium]